MLRPNSHFEVSNSLLQDTLTATEESRFHREQLQAEIDFFTDLDDNHEYLEEMFVKSYEPYVMTRYRQSTSTLHWRGTH